MSGIRKRICRLLLKVSHTPAQPPYGGAAKKDTPGVRSSEVDQGVPPAAPNAVRKSWKQSGSGDNDFDIFTTVYED